jgi:quercetin dioxygenase-like cupin family protein
MEVFMNIKKLNIDDIEWLDVNLEGAKNAKYKILLGDNFGVPNFILRVFKIFPGGHTPLHTHDWEHENFILEGEGILRNSKGEEIKINKGDSIYVPPFEEHQYFNNSEKDLIFICLIPRVRGMKN